MLEHLPSEDSLAILKYVPLKDILHVMQTQSLFYAQGLEVLFSTSAPEEQMLQKAVLMNWVLHERSSALSAMQLLISEDQQERYANRLQTVLRKSHEAALQYKLALKLAIAKLRQQPHQISYEQLSCFIKAVMKNETRAEGLGVLCMLYPFLTSNVQNKVFDTLIMQVKGSPETQIQLLSSLQSFIPFLNEGKCKKLLNVIRSKLNATHEDLRRVVASVAVSLLPKLKKSPANNLKSLLKKKYNAGVYSDLVLPSESNVMQVRPRKVLLDSLNVIFSQLWPEGSHIAINVAQSELDLNTCYLQLLDGLTSGQQRLNDNLLKDFCNLLATKMDASVVPAERLALSFFFIDLYEMQTETRQAIMRTHMTKSKSVPAQICQFWVNLNAPPVQKLNPNQFFESRQKLAAQHDDADQQIIIKIGSVSSDR